MSDHGHGHDGHGHGHDGEHEGGHHGHGHGHGHDDHHHHDADSVGVGILTVSSSRSLDEDAGGDAVAATFEAAGHDVAVRELVGDDFDAVQSAVDRLVGRRDCDVVVTTGGTGVTPDDVTVEAVSPLFEKRLPGFGELFRRQSYDEVGSMVVATRATAGVADGVPTFCLPGSENAATLGAELVVDVAGHLVGLARRDAEGDTADDAESDADE